MKISIPLVFIMNSEINNKVDYSHTKKTSIYPSYK